MEGRLNEGAISILICDAEPEADLLRSHFASAGFRTTLATNGYEAIETIEKERPDFVFLEVMLRSGLSGFGVLSFIEQHARPLVPHTFLVTHLTEQAVLRLAPAFAPRVYRKPASPAELVAAVQRILAGMRIGDDVVIVADDDRDTRHLLAAYLLNHDFKPLLAEDGRAALEAIASGNPRAVLLDLMMPGMDGVSVLEHLGRTNPEILDRIVIVTGLPPEALERLPTLEVRGVLRKPIDFRELGAYLE